MFFRFFAAISAISVALVPTASAAFSFEEPTPGSADRRTLATPQPQRPNAEKIDALQTRYAKDSGSMGGLLTIDLAQHEYDR